MKGRGRPEDPIGTTAFPSKSRRKKSPEISSGPEVLGIIETLDEPRGSLLTEIRNLALLLPGVAETTLYDGFCRHWTPAYYVGSDQIFHVHNFRGGLRATVFAGGKKLVPMILDSSSVPEELRNQLAKSTQGKGIKQVKVELNSIDDVSALLELARLKCQSLY